MGVAREMEVVWDELIDAFLNEDPQLVFFLDRETGEVFFVPDDYEDEAFWQQINANPDQFLQIPGFDYDQERLLLHEFAAATGARLPAPVHAQAHRWRHAFVEQPLGLPCLVDEEIAAGACGDWCIAPRVEAAFESGRTLAHSLVSLVGLSLPSAAR